MDIYSIIAVIIRLVLVVALFKTARRALSSRSRNMENLIEFVSAVGFLLGIWFGLFTLVLIIKFGVYLWGHRGRRLRLNRELLLFLLALIIFLKGPGVISLDHLLGNT